MSIRRKLFFAFVAAAALPLVALAVLARLYLERARVDVDQRFVEHAKEAAHTLSDRACGRTDLLRAAVKRLGNDAFTVHVMAPPELHLLARDWVASEDGEKELQRLKKEKELSEKVIAAVRASASARVLSEDEIDIAAEVKKFRAAHPQVLGVKVVFGGKRVYSDLQQDFDYPAEGVTPRMDDDEERDAPFQVAAVDGRRFMVLVIHEDTTRILVEIDPRAMLEPATVAGVRAFYVTSTGAPRHTAAVSDALLRELPLTALAHDVPMGGQINEVDVGGAGWRMYTAVSAERDRWDYGGDARLVAVAPRSLIDAPLVRFRAEVLAAMLLSLLVAVGLSYYLSGRFGESVENLRRGVDALSRGEVVQLEKSSGDELGGELVESMNRMATVIAERQRREEIESWRRLVRVLSHEINNTLGPVKSVAATVRDTLAPKLEGETGEDLKSSFRLIVDRVDSLSSFISGYAVLAKLPPPKREPADVNDVVRGAASMFEGKVTLRCDPEIGPVPIDKEQIERVVINLVKNAVEAAKARVVVHTERRGDMVHIEVEDDGPGIAPEARAHLFVPYYTTKPGGSGIGLALARQIVLGHGGTVATQDRDGGGTIVSVLLPTSLV